MTMPYPPCANNSKGQKSWGNNSRCLDKCSDRKGHIVDIATFMSVEAKAMLLPEIGMYGTQSVDKVHSGGTAACSKTFNHVLKMLSCEALP